MGVAGAEPVPGVKGTGGAMGRPGQPSQPTDNGSRTSDLLLQSAQAGVGHDWF